MATDPVCGMQVDEATATITKNHDGHVYYFCSEGCKSSFIKNPGQYIETAKPGKPGEAS